MHNTFVSLAVSSVALASSHAMSVLSVKFLDSQDTAWSATDVVGAPGYAQPNWNFLTTDWSGNAVNDAPLANVINSLGNTNSVLQNVTYGGNSDPVHYDSANTWRSGAGTASPNNVLMNGYLDDGQDNQPYINLSLSSAVTGASIVLYFNGDGQNAPVGRYWLEEWTDPLVEGTVITDQVGIDSNLWSGTFTSAGTFSQTATPTNVQVATGNYIVFDNITAKNIRIRGAGNGDPEDFGRGPINGFQLVTVPEPTSIGFLALAGLGALRRRRA